MVRLALAVAVVVMPIAASAMSFMPCRPHVVDVPPNPSVVIEGHDASVVMVSDTPTSEVRDVARTMEPLDANHARVTLALGAGERAYVRGYQGPRCSGRVMRVDPRWRPDRSPPATPLVEAADDLVQLTWDKDAKSWWMRIDWAPTAEALESAAHNSAIATWIEWIELARGARLYVRMTRLLPDGSESTPWVGVIARAANGDVSVAPVSIAPLRVAPPQVAPLPTPSRIGVPPTQPRHDDSDPGPVLAIALLGLAFVAQRRATGV